MKEKNQFSKHKTISGALKPNSGSQEQILEAYNEFGNPKPNSGTKQ
jgi:hypothetical protein